jgi:hypothetical protein
MALQLDQLDLQQRHLRFVVFVVEGLYGFSVGVTVGLLLLLMLMFFSHEDERRNKAGRGLCGCALSGGFQVSRLKMRLRCQERDDGVGSPSAFPNLLTRASMRVSLLLSFMVSISGCAAHQLPLYQPPPPQAASPFCSEPIRGESFIGPLALVAVPAEVSILAKDHHADDLKQESPIGGWYRGSGGSYLFCRYRPNTAKACGSERQVYRVSGDGWAPAETDRRVCQ